MDETPPTRPKPFAFVLMPFDAAFDDVYKLGIKAACDGAGAYSERVDEQQFHERILDRIYNQISKADILIADMSGKNPNVFYEVGYAHGLGKNVILLTQRTDDIPFDFKHFPHIVYSKGIADLKDQLERKVRWAVENPVKMKAAEDSRLEFVMNGENLSNSPGFTLMSSPKGSSMKRFVLDFHNVARKRIGTAMFQLGFKIPKQVHSFRASGSESLNVIYPTKAFSQDGDTRLVVIEETFSVLPGAWGKIFISMAYAKQDALVLNQMYHCSISVYMEDDAPLVVPFSITFA